MKNLLLFLSVFFIATACTKEGCTDVNAFNYDNGKKITTNNTLCEYSVNPKRIRSGAIYSNVVWKKVPGSVIDYHVLGDVRIASGGSLTIEPGVTIAFDLGARIELEGGELLALGTSSEKIKFVNSTPGSSWDGIAVRMDKFSQLNLSYVDIVNASTTVFSFSKYAIECYYSGINSSIILKNVLIDASESNLDCGVKFFNVGQVNAATLTNLSTSGVANDACY